jgi:hypothetical protein
MKHPLSSRFAVTSLKARQLTRFRNCTQIATIIVGEEKKEWRIPTDLLCFHSGYFRSALKGGFAEAEAQRVELLDEKPESFKLVVEWLYTHEIKVSGRSTNTNFYCEQPEFDTLLDTWMLANYL